LSLNEQTKQLHISWAVGKQAREQQRSQQRVTQKRDNPFAVQARPERRRVLSRRTPPLGNTELQRRHPFEVDVSLGQACTRFLDRPVVDSVSTTEVAKGGRRAQGRLRASTVSPESSRTESSTLLCRQRRHHDNDGPFGKQDMYSNRSPFLIALTEPALWVADDAEPLHYCDDADASRRVNTCR
jgi:hypothetical protein